MKQQVAMKLAIAWREFVECQSEHAASLFDILKGGRTARQLV
jgi:hypothetical protein